LAKKKEEYGWETISAAAKALPASTNGCEQGLKQNWRTLRIATSMAIRVDDWLADTKRERVEDGEASREAHKEPRAYQGN